MDDLKTLMKSVTRPTSEYSGIVIDRKEKKTEKEIFKKYTCLAINNEQCETTNHTFQLQVECEYKKTNIYICVMKRYCKLFRLTLTLALQIQKKYLFVKVLILIPPFLLTYTLSTCVSIASYQEIYAVGF